jgi:anaerobic ribonucleoside-triphosphate reductase activating protein
MRLDETFLPIGFVPAPQPNADTVRIGGLQPRSMVAGPGVRSVVWVAGCHRRCPGCIKPEWFDFAAGRSIATETLGAVLLGVAGSDGVTFSGGEPFEQAAALAVLARRLREAGRTILVYTGYRHEVLCDGGVPAHLALLAATDILIDGEYRADVGGAGAWRGSANQRVLPLSPEGRRALEADMATGVPRGDVQVEVKDGGVRVTGCPDPGFMRRFERELAARGVIMSTGDGGEYGH